MKAFDYIMSKQMNWAQNNDVQLSGSKGDRGRPAYTTSLDKNLFVPMCSAAIEQFRDADGGELEKSKDGGLPKMQAIHSSSALAVNVFHYWIDKDIAAIASACGLCRDDNKTISGIKFEYKGCEIDSSLPHRPNIDVVIETSANLIFGIESKFSEAYSERTHTGLRKPYLDLDIWEGIPELQKLGKDISPDDKIFKHLHSAQLIKHILGLKRFSKGDKSKSRLLYLYYDVPGQESADHLADIRKFKECTDADGIRFSHMSYQELIARLAEKHRGEHPDYIKYITERYL